MIGMHLILMAIAVAALAVNAVIVLNHFVHHTGMHWANNVAFGVSVGFFVFELLMLVRLW